MIIKYEYQKEMNKMGTQQKQQQEKIAELKKANQNIQNETNDKCTKAISTIISNYKNASKLYNEFCNKIPEISTRSYDTLDALQKGDVADQKVLEEQIKKSKETFADALFELYNRYSTNLISYIITAVETHLKMNGFEHRVSATIKLFNKPYYESKSDRRSVVVYTAFRDKKTYDENEREIGLKKYTIDGNVDFTHCLKKEQFFINNATKDSQNYLNEHTDFDQYYNCAVVVPIRIKTSGSSYKFFGYLCCDCLNKSEDKREVFGSDTAKILFSMAQLYGTFLETLNSNWMDRTNGQNEERDSYLALIYKKIFIGDNK